MDRSTICGRFSELEGGGESFLLDQNGFEDGVSL
jgi:hypothetical protein